LTLIPLTGFLTRECEENRHPPRRASAVKKTPLLAATEAARYFCKDRLKQSERDILFA
jgi:hypothetical protein